MGITSFGNPSLAPAAPTQIFTQRDSWRVHQLAAWTVIAWECPQESIPEVPLSSAWTVTIACSRQRVSLRRI